MKVVGIGNAIIDVICKVDENFITKNNLVKGTMKLIFDENEFKKLLSFQVDQWQTQLQVYQNLIMK